MNRRTALKNLLIVTGGVIVLPSCLHERSKTSIPLTHLNIGGEEEKLLAELVGTIIPTTNIPGAKDTYTHLFVLNMIDDCFDNDVQEKFTKGIKEVDRMSRDRFNTSFVKSTPAQREQVVAELEKRAENRKENDDLASFYTTVKKLTIQGYVNSKYVLTNVLKFELVPGRYNGAFPVKPTYHKI